MQPGYQWKPGLSLKINTRQKDSQPNEIFCYRLKQISYFWTKDINSLGVKIVKILEEIK